MRGQRDLHSHLEEFRHGMLAHVNQVFDQMIRELCQEEVTSLDVSTEPVMRNTSPPTADVTLQLSPRLTLEAVRKSAMTDWERKKSILFAIPDPLHEGFNYLVGPVPVGCELQDFQAWWKRAVECLRELHGDTNPN